MANRESKSQKETVGRVMHEFKHGELRTRGSGPKVRNSKQAIAIALHEAGATNRESAPENRRNLTRTKAKERQGRTAQAESEGKTAQSRTMAAAGDGKRRSRTVRGERSKQELYQEARRRGIAGRSRMSKSDLTRALQR